MKSLVVFILAACASIAPCTAELYAQTTLPQLSRYSNDTKNYSVDYPAGWQRKEIANLDLFLFAPLKNATQEAPASANIISEKVDPDVTVNKFYTDSVTNLVKELHEVKIEKTGDQIIDGAPAKWIQYNHRIMSINFRVVQYFLVKDGFLFLITLSAPSEDFDAYKSEFDAVILSMRFKSKKT